MLLSSHDHTMLPSGNVLTAAQVRLLTAASPEACPEVPPAAQPHVELIRDGATIQAIEVTCACGSKVRLHCLYENVAGS